jgi:hypothetical protein
MAEIDIILVGFVALREKYNVCNFTVIMVNYIILRGFTNWVSGDNIFVA